jgi:hypothetical protein
VSRLIELVREQILEELPQITDSFIRERAVDREINSLTPLELLERISDALRKGYRQL